jgi:glycosyltransferase involved in cell wall biosynthesis
MNFKSYYFTKNSSFRPRIQEPPSGLLSFIVVIPAYLEENIIRTLESLKAARLPSGHIEVIVVHNFPETESQVNKGICTDQYRQAMEWSGKNSIDSRKFFPLLAGDLPARHAGAGLARKTGMDEALYRFGSAGIPEGIILSLDADTLVSDNYFTAIEKALERNPGCGGCLIPFSHPLEGDEFKPEVYDAILQYELHLRYYKHILKYTGFPHAHYTIGSCFVVKAGVYAQHGGMNQRKAGEDFYFLNKLFPHTHFPEAAGTIVHPSPRPSVRVPFGTGPVINRLINDPGSQYMTYDPDSFFELKKLFNLVPAFFPFNPASVNNMCSKLPNGLQEFLSGQEFLKKLEEISRNTSSRESFVKRFYLWFDGFRVVKYLNFAHMSYFRKIPVGEAAKEFYCRIGEPHPDDSSRELLYRFRRLDGVAG